MMLVIGMHKGGLTMDGQCARCARCDAEFLYMFEGIVFMFENSHANPVFYWLCGECSKEWAIRFSSRGEPHLVAKYDLAA
jgi:hypothetical protein